MHRPLPTEYAPYYATYVTRAPARDVLDHLDRQADATCELLRVGWGEARGDHRYAPDKWSVKEVLGHVIDAERIFGGRAFAFARGERQPLPGMDQDEYAAHARYAERSLEDVLSEYRAVRAASLALFRSMGPEEEARTGIASGCSFTVRTIPWLLAGHELCHLDVLRERYA